MFLLSWMLALLSADAGLQRPIRAAEIGFSAVPVGDLARQRIDLPILDAATASLRYRLVCGSGRDDDHPEDLSGIIMCKLLSADPMQNPRNMFALERPENSRSWDTRGRFLEKEVTGGCGATPNWGRERVFHIGAMVVTLSLRDIEFGADGHVVRYSFAASLRNRTGLESARDPGQEPDWFGRVGPCPL